jgi:hypothetical protein
MKFVKEGKPRGMKKNGEMSLDMYPVCYNFGCDSAIIQNTIFSRKIDKLRSQGKCPSCGSNLCKCKSSIDKRKIGRLVGK